MSTVNRLSQMIDTPTYQKAMEALKEQFIPLVQKEIASPKNSMHEKLYGPERRASQAKGLPFSQEIIDGLQYVTRPFEYGKDFDIENIQARVVDGPEHKAVHVSGYGHPYQNENTPLNELSPLSKNYHKGVCEELTARAGAVLAYNKLSPFKGLKFRAIEGQDTKYFSNPGQSHVMLMAYRPENEHNIVGFELGQGIKAFLKEENTGEFPKNTLIVDPSNHRVGYTLSTDQAPEHQKLTGYKYSKKGYDFSSDHPPTLKDIASNPYEFKFEFQSDPQIKATGVAPLGKVKHTIPELTKRIGLDENTMLHWGFIHEDGETIKPIFLAQQGYTSNFLSYPQSNPYVLQKLQPEHPIRQLFEKIHKGLSQS